LKYGEAGDQYVGRTVTGLNFKEPSFGIVGPRFGVLGPNQTNALLKDLALCFPSYLSPEGSDSGSNSHRFIPILAYSLANVLFHYKAILEIIQSDRHPLLLTPLFVNPGLRERLETFLIPARHSPEATGVPAHIGIMCELSRRTPLDNLPHPQVRAAVEATPGQITREVSKMVQGGTFSAEALRLTLAEVFFPNASSNSVDH
jgi:hypothetical protein